MDEGRCIDVVGERDVEGATRIERQSRRPIGCPETEDAGGLAVDIDDMMGGGEPQRRDARGR
jgi:hypothetical protein